MKTAAPGDQCYPQVKIARATTGWHDDGMGMTAIMTQPSEIDLEPASQETKVMLRAGTPAELVALLPYVFGFPPRESVVVLGFDDRRLAGAARLDVPAVYDPSLLGDPVYMRARLGDITAPGNRLVVVGWMDDADAAARAAEQTVSLLGCVDQTIIVSGGRCRRGDEPWVAYPTALPAAEQAGLSVLEDRAAVAALVRGPSPDDAWDGLWALVCESVEPMSLSQRRKRATELVGMGLDVPHSLSVWQRLELAALVRDGAVRDRLWSRLTSGTAAAFVALWLLIVAVTPACGAPAVLGLLGMAAWVDGNGPLQVCCINRGMMLEPGHSLLRLVETINIMAIHPQTWKELRRSLVEAA